MTAREVFELRRDLRNAESAGRDLTALEARLAAAERELGGKVYRVPGYNLGALLEKVEKVAKRARKLGVGDVTITVAEREKVEVEGSTVTADGVVLTREYAYVVLTGDTPVLADWEFLATLQHLSEGENLVRRMPARGDAVDLTAYRSAAPVCDHCGFNRRRKDTYVVRNVKTGEVKQVGSDCLKDFVGGNDPHRAAKYAEYLMTLDDSLEEGEDDSGWNNGGGMSSNFTDVPTRAYLAHVAAMIRTNGWTARSAAGWDSRATADLAADNLWAMAKKGKDFIEPTEEDSARADAALLWAREVLPERDKLSEFDHNLALIAKQDYMPKRGDGILAYVVVAHARALEHEVKLAERKKRAADSTHFGEVKKRYDLTLTVEAIFENDGHYGTTWITKLRDADGNMFTWFGSYELERGGVYTGKWTVKAHEEFRGELQTVITRPHGLEKTGESEGATAERERVEAHAARKAAHTADYKATQLARQATRELSDAAGRLSGDLLRAGRHEDAGELLIGLKTLAVTRQALDDRDERLMDAYRKEFK